jgi:hypothetical protein
MSTIEYNIKFKERAQKAIQILEMLNGYEYSEIETILGVTNSMLNTNKNKTIPSVLSLDIDYLTKRVDKHIKNIESVKF